MTVPPPYLGRVLWRGRSLGTAFLIHESGLFATCYHVLRAVYTSAAPQGAVGDLVIELLDDRHVVPVRLTDRVSVKDDVAILEALDDTIAGLGITPPPLIRASSIDAGAEFWTAGYGLLEDPEHDYRYNPAIGRVLGSAKRDGVDVLQLDSKHVLLGMSGAPVIVGTHGVIGVISGRYNVHRNDLWSRDTVWATTIEKVVDLAGDLLQLTGVERQARAFDDESIQQYLENIVFLYGSWESNYTTLRLASDGEHPRIGAHPAVLARQAAQSSIPATEMLAASNSLVVLGEAGAGKTTTLHFLAQRCAAQSVATSEAPTLPVLINLSEYTPGSSLNQLILQALAFTFGQMGIKADEHDLQQIIRRHRLLILMDGLNEVKPRLVKQCTQTIVQYATNNPDHQYVVTARVYDFKGQFKHFGVMRILPLNSEQVHDLLERRIADGAKLAQVKKVLETRSRHLASVPLFVNVLLSVYEETHGIPNTEGELIGEYVKMLLSGSLEAEERYSTEIQYLLLEHIALAMQQRGLLLEIDEVNTLVATHAKEPGGGLPGEDWVAAVVDSLCSSGILVLTPEKRIRFWHQIMQEFFVGRHLARQYEKASAERITLLPGNETRSSREILRTLKKGLRDQNNHRPLAMMVDLLHEKQATTFLKTIVLRTDITLGSWLARRLKNYKALEQSLLRHFSRWINLANVLVYTTATIIVSLLLTGMTITYLSRSQWANTQFVIQASQLLSSYYRSWYTLLVDILKLGNLLPEAVAAIALILSFVSAVSIALFIAFLILDYFEKWVSRRYLEPVLQAIVAFDTEKTRSFLYETYIRTTNNPFYIPIPEFRQEFQRAINRMSLDTNDQDATTEPTERPFSIVDVFIYSQNEHEEGFEALLEIITTCNDPHIVMPAITRIVAFSRSSEERRDQVSRELLATVGNHSRPYTIRKKAHWALQRLGQKTKRPLPRFEEIIEQLRRSMVLIDVLLVPALFLSAISIFSYLIVTAITLEIPAELRTYLLAGLGLAVSAIVFFRPENELILSPLLWVRRLFVVLFAIAEQPVTYVEATENALKQQSWLGKMQMLVSLTCGSIIYCLLFYWLFRWNSATFAWGVAAIILCIQSISFVVIRMAPELPVVKVAQWIIQFMALPFNTLMNVSSIITQRINPSILLRSQRLLKRFQSGE